MSDQVLPWLFNFSWLAWVLYWLIAGRGRLKPVAQRESRLERLGHIVPLVIAIGLFWLPDQAHGLLFRRFTPPSSSLAWLGLGITVVGLVFSVYARRYLGGNWSGTVTLKEGHTLVREGPYRLIRHPIYTGLIAAFAGTALAQGQVRGLLSLILVAGSLVVKLGREERWMGERFGDEYRHYRTHSWALLPWIF
jgi:protein-S-isoprenylcysteine O-methyltransferase Ste14